MKRRLFFLCNLSLLIFTSCSHTTNSDNTDLTSSKAVTVTSDITESDNSNTDSSLFDIVSEELKGWDSVLEITNNGSWISVTVKREEFVTRAYDWLAQCGIDIYNSEIDIHPQLKKVVPVPNKSEEKISEPSKIITLLKDYKYELGTTTASHSSNGVNIVIPYIFDHNVQDIYDYLNACGVDMDIIEFQKMERGKFDDGILVIS